MAHGDAALGTALRARCLQEKVLRPLNQPFGITGTGKKVPRHSKALLVQARRRRRRISGTWD